MIPFEPCTQTFTWYQIAILPKDKLAPLLNKEVVEQLIVDLNNSESIQECQKAFPNIYDLRNIPFKIVSRVIRKMPVTDEEQMNRLSQAMTNARVWPELSPNSLGLSYGRHNELHLAIRKAAIKGSFVASGFFLEHLQAITSPSNLPVPTMSTQDRQVTGELIALYLSGQLKYDLLEKAVQKVIQLSIKSRHCIKIALGKMLFSEKNEPQYKKQRIFMALADVPNDEVEGIATAFQHWDVKAIFRQYQGFMPSFRSEIITILRALAPEHRDLFRELYSTKFNDHERLIPLLCAMSEEIRFKVYGLINEENREKEKPIKRYVNQISPCSFKEAEEIYKIHQRFEEPLEFYSKVTILNAIKNTPQAQRQEVADIVSDILKTSWDSSKSLKEFIPENREDLIDTVKIWLEKATVRRYLDTLISPPKNRYDWYHDSLKKTLITALTSLSFQSIEELFPSLKQIKFETLATYSKDLLAILLQLAPAHRETFATLFSTQSEEDEKLIGIICSVKGSETETRIYKLIENISWTLAQRSRRFVELIYPCSFDEACELYTSYGLFKNPISDLSLDPGVINEIKSLPAGRRIETTRKASILAVGNRMIEQDPECIGRLGKLDPKDQEEVFQAVSAWQKRTGVGIPIDLIDAFADVPRGQRLAYGEAVLCYGGWCLYNLVDAVKNSTPEKRAEVCAAMIYFKDKKLTFDWTIDEIIDRVRKPLGEIQGFDKLLKL